MSGETKTIAIFGIATLAIVIFGIMFFSKEPTVKSPVAVNQEILIRENSPKDSSQNEKAVLVEFGDYQCPACAAYHDLVLDVLAQDDSITYVFRHFPLSQHKNARVAAKASESAGIQGKYFEMHDILYEKQAEWAELSNPEDKFVEYASSLSLDSQKFKTDMALESLDQKITRDYTDGITLGVNSTPTFFVNGKKIPGARNAEDFKRIISEYSSE